MAYLGNTPTTVTRIDFIYVANNNQTVFTGVDSNGLVLSYDVNNYDVFANGVLLNKQNDYTSATGASITLNVARFAGDIITIRAYGIPSSLNALLPAKVDKTQIGTFNYRNLLINGNFDIWQRALSQTSSGYGSADRWQNLNNGTTKTTSLQAFANGQTAVPGNPWNFMRTVVSSVAGAGNYCLTTQKIENVQMTGGKNYTLTFWAKADASRNISTQILQNFGTGGSPSAAVGGICLNTCALTTSWKQFQFYFSVPSISGLTVGTNGDHNTQLQFWFDAGSSFNGQTNSLGQQSGTFDIARVSIVEGDATLETDPFSPRPFAIEYSLCQRYFCSRAVYSGFTATAASQISDTSVYFPSIMRATPTLTPVGTITNTNVFSEATGVLTNQGFKYQIASVAAGTSNIDGRYYFCDAEL